MKIIVDSYAWIEHFIGSEKGAKSGELLENTGEYFFAFLERR